MKHHSGHKGAEEYSRQAQNNWDLSTNINVAIFVNIDKVWDIWVATIGMSAHCKYVALLKAGKNKNENKSMSRIRI